MPAFRVKRLFSSGNVSEYLKNLREAKGLTAEDAAKELKIPLRFIKALENGELKDFSRDVYARKYLDAYLRFLGEEAANFYSILAGLAAQAGNKGGQNLASIFTSPPFPDTNRSYRGDGGIIQTQSFPRNLKLRGKVGGVILILLFFGYLSFQFYEFFKAPKLEVYFPPDNSVVHEPLVIVEGKTESETPLYINGTEVMLSRDGAFREEIGLQKGANIIKIEAAKRYGRKSAIFKKVLFE